MKERNDEFFEDENFLMKNNVDKESI